MYLSHQKWSPKGFQQMEDTCKIKKNFRNNKKSGEKMLRNIRNIFSLL